MAHPLGRGYAVGMTFTETTGLLTRFFNSPAPRLAPPVAAAAPQPVAPAPPSPSRQVEGRVEFRGMLWHPAYGISDEAGLVVTAKAGLPHCARCDKALSLVAAAKESWCCAACGASHPGKDVDFYATDTVIAEGLAAFLAAHPGYTAAESLAPTRALQRA